MLVVAVDLPLDGEGDFVAMEGALRRGFGLPFVLLGHCLQNVTPDLAPS